MPEENDKGLKVGISLSRKLNLGNYESADVWVSLTNIEPGTTREEMEAALATGALAYDVLKVAIKDKIADQRNKAE
ncbi:MAG: hypothetical protein PHY28_04330 [Dehalococcoidales bacterium]|nr:hypothetical protein [Dehalococcoidales bacterium]